MLYEIILMYTPHINEIHPTHGLKIITYRPTITSIESTTTLTDLETCVRHDVEVT